MLWAYGYTAAQPAGQRVFVVDIDKTEVTFSEPEWPDLTFCGPEACLVTPSSIDRQDLSLLSGIDNLMIIL